jgi:hypothetical protein
MTAKRDPAINTRQRAAIRPRQNESGPDAVVALVCPPGGALMDTTASGEQLAAEQRNEALDVLFYLNAISRRQTRRGDP